jgi:anti-anti-sigma factor
MTIPQGVVRVRQHGQTLTFQVKGRATMQQSPSVRRFTEHCCAHGTNAVWVDLRHCTHMDSTFLGTLLVLKRAVEQQEQGKFALISPSPQCCRVLQHMGLDEFFSIVTEQEPEASDWTELKSESDDLTAFKRNVVQAHQELARLEGPAGESFRALADHLTGELGKKG